MKPRIDVNLVRQKMLNELTAIKGEVRAEVILLQAHVEFLIAEIIEILLETDILRGTKTRLDVKLDILKELNWLSKDTISDIRILSTIRGYVAHRIDVYDPQTRSDIENQFKQIKLLKKADPQIFPKSESMQSHLKQIAGLYFLALSDTYNSVYKLKSNQSLKNPNSLGENYRFFKQNDEITMVYDSI